MTMIPASCSAARTPLRKTASSSAITTRGEAGRSNSGPRLELMAAVCRRAGTRGASCQAALVLRPRSHTARAAAVRSVVLGRCSAISRTAGPATAAGSWPEKVAIEVCGATRARRHDRLHHPLLKAGRLTDHLEQVRLTRFMLLVDGVLPVEETTQVLVRGADHAVDLCLMRGRQRGQRPLRNGFRREPARQGSLGAVDERERGERVSPRTGQQWIAPLDHRERPRGRLGGNGWTFWQYTSSGSVDGVSSLRVDLDRFNVRTCLEGAHPLMPGLGGSPRAARRGRIEV